MEPKPTWQERARQTATYYKELLRTDKQITIEMVAFRLRRSKGSVAEDILIASWFETHPDITKFPCQKDALEFIRVKKHEMRVR
jgi:hypothetical protein